MRSWLVDKWVRWSSLAEVLLVGWDRGWAIAVDRGEEGSSDAKDVEKSVESVDVKWTDAGFEC